MHVRHPLEGCNLAFSSKDAATPFDGVASSLLYQAKALGVNLTSGEAPSSDKRFAFTLETPLASDIDCEISGWPEPAHGCATEHLMQASCGLMSIHGRASGRAQPLGLDYISTVTSALSLQGAIAATIGKSRGLAVTRSEVSFAAAGLLCAGQYIADASAPEALEGLLPGACPAEERPPFVSADGIVFELETLDVHEWRAFWAEIGVDASLAGKGWSGFLLRYAKAISPLPPALREALSSMTYAAISESCLRTGVSICPMRSLRERAQDDDVDWILQNGPWSFQPGSDRLNRPISQPSSELPLSGLTVIESCRRIQGPLAGHLLALLGAEVIRVEPPGGDPLRGMPPMADGVSARYDALNRLKIVREIDIKSASGQAEVKELARSADVFLHNWAPGKAASLNLDYADLASVNPSLIYAYAGGWGPEIQLSAPGTDFMTQAYSGVASKIAQASGIMGGSLFTVLDVMGGVVAAQGITVALLAGLLHRFGMKVDTSLLGSATLLCADELSALRDGINPIQSRRDRKRRFIKGVYPTKKGLIAIECGDEHATFRLSRAIGVGVSIDDCRFKDRMSDALLGKSADDWIDIFKIDDLPAAIVVEDLRDLEKDERIRCCLDRRRYTQVNSPWRFQ